jgi:hypothetical protein
LYPAREQGLQCWWRGQVAALNDYDFKRSERKGRENKQEGQFNINLDL